MMKNLKKPTKEQILNAVAAEITLIGIMLLGIACGYTLCCEEYCIEYTNKNWLVALLFIGALGPILSMSMLALFELKRKKEESDEHQE